MGSPVQAPKQRLFQITDKLKQMFALYEESEQEDERVVIRREIARVASTELPEKVDGCAHFDKSCDADVAELKKIIHEAQARIKQIEARKAFIRAIIRRAMVSLGAVKLRGYIKNISLRDGGYSLVIGEEKLIPDHFRTVTITTDSLTWETIKQQLPRFYLESGAVQVQSCVNNAAVKKAQIDGEAVWGAALSKDDPIVVIRSNTQPTRPKPRFLDGEAEDAED